MTTGSYATFLYQFDGFSTFPRTNGWKYDTTADTWASIKAIPTARASQANQNAMAATVGDAIYVCGGVNANKKVEAYYPLTDTWATKQDMPQAHVGGAIGATATMIYVAGGAPAPNSKKLDIYDVATNTWTTGVCACVLDGFGGGRGRNRQCAQVPILRPNTTSAPPEP
jgi:hypothetical protein